MQSDPGSQSPHPCGDIPDIPRPPRASVGNSPAMRGELNSVKNLWAAVNLSLLIETSGLGELLSLSLQRILCIFSMQAIGNSRAVIAPSLQDFPFVQGSAYSFHASFTGSLCLISKILPIHSTQRGEREQSGGRASGAGNDCSWMPFAGERNLESQWELCPFRVQGKTLGIDFIFIVLPSQGSFSSTRLREDILIQVILFFLLFFPPLPFFFLLAVLLLQPVNSKCYNRNSFKKKNKLCFHN